MWPAVYKTLTALLMISLVFVASISPTIASTGEYQSCSTSSTCIIGEFLYDDEYQPISTATCTLTAKYPNGTTFLNGVSMTGNSDGWYSYSATTDTTTGIYRASVCCTTTSSEYLCLDKTFEVIENSGSSLTASDIWSYSNRSLSSYDDLASTVWGYSSRSLTSFGNLIQDIWGYSSRSLTSFGNLSSDIWGNSTRTLTSATLSSGSLSTDSTEPLDTDTLDNIYATVIDNNELLEKLVNKPIIESFIKDDSEANLDQKLEQTEKIITNLGTNITLATGQSLILYQNWNSLSNNLKANELQELISSINNPNQEYSLSKSYSFLQSNWNDDSIAQISSYSEQILSTLQSLNPTTDTQTLKELNQNLSSLSLLITDDLVTFLDQTKKTNQLISSSNQQLNKLLEEWPPKDQAKTLTSLNQLQTNFNLYNRLTNIESLKRIKTGESEEKRLKNQILNLIGLNKSNPKLIASAQGTPINHLWLEEGSIVFRILATNPSSKVTQDVEIKYYLPEEISENNIIDKDPLLNVNFDPEKNTLYLSGNITLGPLQSETYLVEVEDVWTIPTEELESLRTQAITITDGLKKTSFHPQALSILSDINVAIDKVILKQKQATTPESRIKAFRESLIDLKSIRDKIDSLKSIATESSSQRSVLGFIGGTQAIAVWGLIVVIIAGFVFLTIFIGSQKKGKNAGLLQSLKSNPKIQRLLKKLPILSLIFLVSTTISGTTAYKILKGKYQPEPVLGESITTSETITIKGSPNNPINLYSNESKNSDVVAKISSTQSVFVKGKLREFYLITPTDSPESTVYYMSIKDVEK